MLSWSSSQSGDDADLSVVASGATGLGLDHGDALLAFATQCAQDDDDALAGARTKLAEAADEEFMIDAAAVAANFEMMTRLADSTGSRLTPESVEARAAQIGVMGVAELTSRR